MNEELIDKMKEDDIMCQALMRIMKPEFDAALEAAVEDAQAMTEVSDELVSKALEMC